MKQNNKHKQHSSKPQKPQKRCYYDVLQVEREAPLEVIKQSYKKLALKYHPDKNEDKDTSKRLFTEISEAYTVLTDPEKRQMYDTLGHVDEQELNFDAFDLFAAGHYQEFESFINEMMGFPDLSDLTKMFGKASMRRGNKRAKHASRGLRKMFEGEPKRTKKTEQKSGEDKDWQTESDQDNWESDSSSENGPKEAEGLEMLEQELMFPLFVSEHSDVLRGKKKGMFRCALDKLELKEDDLFDHFDECHRKQYSKWCKDT